MSTPAFTQTTTVRVHYPAGASITVRGSGGPLRWDQDASLQSNGELYVFSSNDVSSPLEVKPLAWGAWSKGPNYRVNPGQTIDVYPHFQRDDGWFERRWDDFASSHLPDHRGIWVYFPASYPENTTARYPVIYMADGQNLFPNWRASGGSWHADDAMNAGVRDGSIQEALIVGFDNTPNRENELTPTHDPTEPAGGMANQTLAMLTDELKPLIDREMRTRPGREDTGIAGSSLGGVFSIYAAATRPDVFGRMGSFSPATWWDDMVVYRIVDGGPRSPSLNRVYVDSGDSGIVNDDVGFTHDLVGHYEGVGYSQGSNLKYVVGHGDSHNESAWASRLPNALRFLLGPR